MTAQEAAALLNYFQATAHIRGVVSAGEVLAMQPGIALLQQIAAGRVTCTCEQVRPAAAQAAVNPRDEAKTDA